MQLLKLRRISSKCVNRLLCHNRKYIKLHQAVDNHVRRVMISRQSLVPIKAPSHFNAAQTAFNPSVQHKENSFGFVPYVPDVVIVSVSSCLRPPTGC